MALENEVNREENLHKSICSENKWKSYICGYSGFYFPEKFKFESELFSDMLKGSLPIAKDGVLERFGKSQRRWYFIFSWIRKPLFTNASGKFII